MRYTVWFFERAKGKSPSVNKEKGGGHQQDNDSSNSSSSSSLSSIPSSASTSASSSSNNTTVEDNTMTTNQLQWIPFSKSDSTRIEKAYLNNELDEPILVDGTFYVVNLAARTITDAYYGKKVINLITYSVSTAYIHTYIHTYIYTTTSLYLSIYLSTCLVCINNPFIISHR